MQALAADWPDEQTRTLLADHTTTHPDGNVRQVAERTLARFRRN